MKSDDKIITVYRALGQPEAEIVRGRLKTEGIPSFLKYESIGTVYGLTVDGLGQVEVQVPASYAAEAKRVIGQDNEAETGHI